MKIAITGGTGFVGGHLAHRFAKEGQQLLLLARSRNPKSGLPSAPGAQFLQSDLSNWRQLAKAFIGCDAVAHCAGINREIGPQTYERVHVQGTSNVVRAATQAGVHKLVLMSFLRARPNCGSAYHESKWAAEEIVRASSLDYTIVKAGMVYGRGDHMLDHLSHSLRTIPLFATVGLREKSIQPLAIEDLIAVLDAALRCGELSRKTVAITGAEQLYLSEAVRRVARGIGRKVLIVPSPVWFQFALAQLFEWTMKVPLIAKAQVRILAEGVTEPAKPCDPLPPHLLPTHRFTDEQVSSGLPAARSFGLRDLRVCT